MEFRQMSKDELKAKYRSKGVVVVNTLDREDYNSVHIKGSISMPYEELIKDGWKALDKKKEVVTYCQNFLCSASRESAEFLQKKGFKVSAYEGGIEEWQKSGLPVEGTSV